MTNSETSTTDDIQEARAWLMREDQYPEDWCEGLTDDIESTLLRALDALEMLRPHGPMDACDSCSELGKLASCEEECARLREQRQERVAAQVTVLRRHNAETSAELARVEAECERMRADITTAYRSRDEAVERANRCEWHEMPYLTADRDRLAAVVQGAKDVLSKWRRSATLTPSEHEAMRRALDGEVG